MHEASLARALLGATLDRATREGARRVLRVAGWIAETEPLSRDSIALHFGALARGTLADGAVLDLQLLHVEADCRACGTRFAPDAHVLLCPACGATEVDVLGQTGVGLHALDVEES